MYCLESKSLCSLGLFASGEFASVRLSAGWKEDKDPDVIETELAKVGIKEVNLLTVDYFFWDELQVEEKLTQIHKKDKKPPIVEPDTSNFIHNEIRDKLADIGEWLGFTTKTETKVAEGSKVDTIWEATIGNMGRIIYVFEVQTKGSIDSLIRNTGVVSGGDL